MKPYRERAEEIAAGLRALPGAGQVHARSRVAGKSWGEFLRRFENRRAPGVRQIAGWTVSRASGRQGGEDGGDANWLERYTLIRIVGVHDETESEFDFQESLDRAVAHFRDHPELSFGVVSGEVELRVIEERVFGEVTCHVAECDLVVAMDFNQLGDE